MPYLRTRVVRLGVPRVGPAFAAIRRVVPRFAGRTLPRKVHVTSPQRSAADVTRPRRGIFPRTVRPVRTPRREGRGGFRRYGTHFERQATCAGPPVPVGVEAEKRILTSLFADTFRIVRGRPLTLSLTHSLRNARVPKDSVLSTHVRGGVPPKMLCSQTRDGALGRSRRRYRPASGPRPVATRGFSSPCSETSFLRR